MKKEIKSEKTKEFHRTIENNVSQEPSTTKKNSVNQSPKSSSPDEVDPAPASGSLADREHRKWVENAIVLPNNPYSKECIEKRKINRSSSFLNNFNTNE